ncbi:hypothetical protein Veis_2418 [Verminephrobacter eiseniae EF01-2]|uniref:Uncharacterized protein n=1 Tax=Verminephrobacter eiseniae (strain EF01-2) TaxID=391735 RepID=A1WKK7_VEREI|nr:hypothetical protein Veis_2418 [Verminephrobacter eiseniae EF01-2]
MFVHCQAVYIIKMMLLCAANQTFSNRSATTAGRTAFDDLPDPRRRECPHRFDELLQLLGQPFPGPAAGPEFPADRAVRIGAATFETPLR